MKNPNPCVFATTGVAKGHLLLVPMAGFSNLRVKKTGEEAPRRSSEVAFDVDGARGIVINRCHSSECTVLFLACARRAREERRELQGRRQGCQVQDAAHGLQADDAAYQHHVQVH